MSPVLSESICWMMVAMGRWKATMIQRTKKNSSVEAISSTARMALTDSRMTW